MAQHLYVDFRDGHGERDYTKFLQDFDRLFTHEMNRPALMDFTLVPVGDLTHWRAPERGAIIRFEDSAFLSRIPGVRDGIVFTGYITGVPQIVQLGSLGLWAYQCVVTSEDYLANIHATPSVTYINKTRGYIIKDLMRLVFKDSLEFPFNLDQVYDGGEERFYQVDPTRKFTDIVEEFAKADGYTYFCVDRHMVYQPQNVFMEEAADPKIHLVIDELDPRYSPQALSLKRIDTVVANDVSVIGDDEPGMIVREYFISDGYSGTFTLAHEPFGIVESSVLKDDFADTLDDSIWFESDEGDFIQVFEGSLNVTGGLNPGETKSETFLRSRHGVDLSGILDFRDGEIFFGPTPSGVGIIGGLYVSADEEMDETTLLCGWKLDMNNNWLLAMGPNGVETGNYIPINPLYHYLLRRSIHINGAARLSNGYYSFVDGNRVTFAPADSGPAVFEVIWSVDVINPTDPENVITINTPLMTRVYNIDYNFALYCPIVSYDLHCVMNFVEISKPQQATVHVNGTAVKIGNALDQGVCTLVPNASGIDGAGASLSWYTEAVGAANPTSTGVTVPKLGSVVEVRYWKKEKALARVVNQASIDSEQQRFLDDGIRQLTINSGDVTPIPKTSAECLALGQAYLVDRSVSRYDGSYSVDIGQGCPTEMNYWIFPGDLVPIDLPQPDGTRLQRRLLVSKVTSTCAGSRVAGSCYTIQLQFGAFNRVDEAIRQLVVKRQSSLDELVYQTLLKLEPDYISDDDLPPDPTNWFIFDVRVDLFRVRMTGPNSTTLPDGVVGYDVRKSDSGWGQPNYVARFATSDYTFTRGKRDEKYFIRPFNAAGQYSRHSACVRIVRPLVNTTTLPDAHGWVVGTDMKLTIPLPIDPDLGGIVVDEIQSDGTVRPIYWGDGVDGHPNTGVTALVANNAIEINAPVASVVGGHEPPVTERGLIRTIRVYAYDLTYAAGPYYSFEIDEVTYLRIASVASSWISSFYYIRVNMALLTEPGGHAAQGIRIFDQDGIEQWYGGFDGIHTAAAGVINNITSTEITVGIPDLTDGASRAFAIQAYDSFFSGRFGQFYYQVIAKPAA